MTLDDLARITGEWLRGVGPMSDVVISSRVRLARNLANYPFLATASEHERADIYRTLAERIAATSGGADALLVDVETTGPIDRQWNWSIHSIGSVPSIGRRFRSFRVAGFSASSSTALSSDVSPSWAIEIEGARGIAGQPRVRMPAVPVQTGDEPVGVHDVIIPPPVAPVVPVHPVPERSVETEQRTIVR